MFFSISVAQVDQRRLPPVQRYNSWNNMAPLPQINSRSDGSQTAAPQLATDASAVAAAAHHPDRPTSSSFGVS